MKKHLLKIEYLPVSQIKPYEKNPRYNDDAVDRVAESIRQYGFQQPIVVDKNYVIIAGHTRLRAAQSLGYDKVPVIIASDLTEKQAQAYRLADNKTSEFSFWDNKLLLEELGEIDVDLFTGFDIGDLFDDVLDENENEPVEENKNGVTYEVVFRSEDIEKVKKIRQLWESEFGEIE